MEGAVEWDAHHTPPFQRRSCWQTARAAPATQEAEDLPAIGSDPLSLVDATRIASAALMYMRPPGQVGLSGTLTFDLPIMGESIGVSCPLLKRVKRPGG